MKVPINPTTNFPTGQLGYEQPVDVSAGTRALADVVNQFASYAADEQKKHELFDVQKQLVDETNNLEQDFDAKTQVQPLGAPNFVQQVAGEYNTRHQQMVGQLKAQGYGEDAVNEFATRLGALRSQYVARAIDFQQKSEFSKVNSDADQMALGLSQYVNKNPNAIGSALDEMQTALHNSGLDAPEQERLFQDKKAAILKSAQDGFALQHPDVVLGLYGEPNEITVTSPANLPAGQQFNLPEYIGKLNPAEGTGKNPLSSATGAFQFQKGTWLENYKQVFPHSGETDDQILAKRSDAGTATKVLANFTNNNIQALVAAKIPINDSTVYLAHFLGVHDAIKVLSAHADQTIAGLVTPASIKANPKVFKNINTAQNLIDWASGKMGEAATATATATPLKPIPVGWKGNQEDAIQELGMTADQAATFLKTGKDTRVASDTPAVMGYPVIQNPDKTDWQVRADGSTKGTGFLGLLQRPDGNVSSEISVGVEINGKEQEIPLMVPGLTKPELDYLMTHDPESKGFQKNMPKTILKKAEDHASARIAQGQSPFAQDGETPAASGTPTADPAVGLPGQVVLSSNPTPVDEMGQTGIPILDMSSGTDREQMLVIARSEMNKKEEAAKQSQRDSHDTWYNNFLNQVDDGTLGQNDINTAYHNGQFSTYEERARAQSIFDAKNKVDKNLINFSTIINSNLRPSPFDDDAKKAVDVGYEKGLEDIAKNKKNISPLDYALHLWQRTGILPTKGAVMLRGALVGTDPAQVAAAASVASNMLKENPNAFAGVDGGDEIGKAAANYTHYVDDLGMNAQDAANKIAIANSPEFQAKTSANAPAREAFVQSINGSIQQGKVQGGIDISKVLNDALVGSPGWLSTLTFHYFDPARGTFSAPQQAEAKQTYLELALDNYDKYHDPQAAMAYATRQMSRFYGVEAGRIIKYPANKAYPSVMGSTDYIYDQAKAEVDKYAGFAVPKEDIFLQPTATGSTAAAFRAGQAPPYEVNFVTHQNGQAIYHHIPGRVFIADVNTARADAAKKARAAEKAARQALPTPQFGG